MDKTISWKNVNMLGYIVQIIAQKQFYDIIELHSLELLGFFHNSNDAIFHFQTSARSSTEEKNETGRRR